MLLLLSTPYPVVAGEPWRIHGTVYDQDAGNVSCRIAVLPGADTVESDAKGYFTVNAGNRESITLVFFTRNLKQKR